ncbi:tetratricopeptide repeat protein [Kitasatospora xanthocidica]|uniref:tetratricopeptide repeat protein n=1 Tax=Kitasatospora xanthocidica TaxID=83382 RepID=UPI0036E6E023
MCDAALLLADADLVEPEVVPPVRWGEPEGTHAWPGCEIFGFPHAQRTDRRPDTEQFIGTLKPGSSVMRERYVIDSAHSAPQPSLDGSPWRGMSGAAVLLDDYLVGLTVEDPRGWAHGRLEAVPARTLLADSKFIELVEQYTGARPVLEVIRHRTGHRRFAWEPVGGAQATDFGIHPVREVSGLPNVVRYVPRDLDKRLDEQLRAAAEQGGFVLVTGNSATGKTRSAFEAMRRTLGEWEICRPDPASDLGPLAEDCRAAGTHRVVWLDDLEGHLHAKGLTGELLTALQNAGAVVLATLRSQLYDRYLRQSARRSTADAFDGPGLAELVLRRATRVAIDRIWSDKERATASLSADPRLDEALAAGNDYGLPEYLAGGPQLAERLRAAVGSLGVDGGNPRGAALVLAAVDLARTGLASPLPAEVLERLHQCYLKRAGGARLRPEPLSDAWTWATETLLGVTSLLVPDDDELGWRPFDYLVADDAWAAGAAPVADEAWQEATQLVNGPSLLLLAWNAQLAERPDVALAALRPAAESGETPAMTGLAGLLIGQGTPEARKEGEQWLREASGLGDSAAMYHLGALLARTDDPEGAHSWLDAAVQAGETRALRALGDLALRGEDEETAREVWLKAAQAGDAESAVRYGDWLRRNLNSIMGERAVWLGSAAAQGLPAAALAYAGTLAYSEYPEEADEYVQQAYEGALPRARSGDPDAMITIGTILALSGHLDLAETWLRRARQRAPMLMPDWQIVYAPEGQPGLPAVAVSRETVERLAPGQLAEAMALLWSVDCQYCGYALGDGVPALRVFEQHGVASATLNHLGMCRYPDWLKTDGTAEYERLGMITVIGSSRPLLSWRATVVRTGLLRPDGKAEVAALVNPGLESIDFVQPQREGDGWRLGVTDGHRDRGLVAPGERLRRLKGSVTVSSTFVTLQLDIETWRAPVPPAIALEIERQGGMYLVLSSGVPDSVMTQNSLEHALRAADVAVGWLPIAW